MKSAYPAPGVQSATSFQVPQGYTTTTALLNTTLAPILTMRRGIPSMLDSSTGLNNDLRCQNPLH